MDPFVGAIGGAIGLALWFFLIVITEGQYRFVHILRYPLLFIFVFAYPTWDFFDSDKENLFEQFFRPVLYFIFLIYIARSIDKNNGNMSERRKKKEFSKRMVEYLQPTIKSAIEEHKETTDKTLSSDLYYGYIVGYITQQLRRVGYKESEFDFKVIYDVLKRLSNRHVAEAHRFALEAFYNEHQQYLGRDAKKFEDGFNVGEYDARNLSQENLKNILLDKKLHYRIR
jgi:hypothetical protein